LMLVMVHAMMEFTISLLVQRPQDLREPIQVDRLRERLLAVNETGQPHPITAGKDCDLEVEWELEKAPLPGRLTVSRAASRSHLRLLLDERRHQVRMNQADHSYYLFFGFAGWLPRITAYAGIQSGPPGGQIIEQPSRISTRSGWSVRPVLWWFQATYSGYRLLEILTPAPFRHWSARRFWGIRYPVSFFLGIGYLAAIIGSLESKELVLLAGISAIWWGVWGLLVWMLCGFPAFWRRSGR
jgi:hypothetical protein